MFIFLFLYFILLLFYYLQLFLRALPDSNRRLYFKVLVFKTSAINQTRPSTLVAYSLVVELCLLNSLLTTSSICFNLNTIFFFFAVTFFFLLFLRYFIFFFYSIHDYFYFILYTFIIIPPWLLNKLNILRTPPRG